jgi:hypothetical protein
MQKLHEAGLIQPSSSDFVVITLMPAKKDSASLRTEKKSVGIIGPQTWLHFRIGTPCASLKNYLIALVIQTSS